MIVREVMGDLLSSKCDIICHQVNCQAVMTNGVSKAIRRAYPLVFEQYSRFLNNNYLWKDGQRINTSTFLGLCQIVKIGNDKYIGNLFGQDYYGKRDDGVMYTDYNALFCSLVNLKRLVLFGGYNIRTIAFPHRMGCFSGGADWDKVFEMIKGVFNDLDVVIEIVHLPQLPK